MSSKARITRRISIQSTSSLTLEELEEFTQSLRELGAPGTTRIDVHEDHPDRPGELSTYRLAADIAGTVSDNSFRTSPLGFPER